MTVTPRIGDSKVLESRELTNISEAKEHSTSVHDV